jgi:hypothetical protein
MTKVVGVDSGSKGCICLLDVEEKAAKYLLLPYRKDGSIDGRSIDISFECFENVNRIYLEKVHGRGGDDCGWGASQSFGFGRNYGVILQYLSYYPYHLVSPQAWQKPAHQGISRPTAKERTRAAFQMLNPSFGVISNSDDGLIDSFFIARYALQQLGVAFCDDWSFFNMK